MKRTGSVLLIFLLAALPLYAETVLESGNLSWKSTHPGIRLEKKNGVLHAVYSMKHFRQVQQENWLFHRETADLLLEKPVTLDPETRRIIFEARGFAVMTWNTRDKMVHLWPVIRDASGEILCYVPQKYPHIYPGKETWSGWMTPDFYCGEAGGASDGVCFSEGGDGTNRPEGKLEFLGFRLIVHTPQPEKDRTGEIRLGRIRLTGSTLKAAIPFFYSEAVCRKRGNYHFSGSIAADYQGAPVAEKEFSFTFEPGERRRIEMPIPQRNGDFWGEWALTDQTGKHLAGGNFRHTVFGEAEDFVPKTLPAEKAPLMGYLKTDPKHGPVFRREEKLAITIRVFPKEQKKVLVRCELIAARYLDKFGEKTFSVTRNRNGFSDIVFHPDLPEGRDAARLRIRVSTPEGKLLQTKEYLFGRLTDHTKPRQTRRGALPDRNKLKEHSYNRATFILISTAMPKTETDLIRLFGETMDQSGAGKFTPNWSASMDPADMEVLPGVFDFAPVDKLLDAAADRGVFLTFMIAHVESRSPYRWVRYSSQHNFDGLPIDEHYYGGFSLGDRNYLELWHRLNRALYDRYRLHPAFQGYYLFQPAGEFTIEDKPWAGIIAGYEEALQEPFREYLKKDLGLDLAKLNARWKTHLKSWKEVLPPKPTLELGFRPDLRMSWFDWMNFKFKLSREGFFPEAVRRIRSYSANHVIILYGAYSGETAGKFYGKADYYHNGGNHYWENERMYVPSWTDGKIGWITEPHHPQQWANYAPWILDWSMYIAFLQADGGGANLHVYYDPRHKTLVNLSGSTFAYDRVRKYFPVLDELVHYRAVSPEPETGVLQDAMTLAAKHRTTFKSRLDDLKRFFELYKLSGIPTVRVLPENAGNLKLIVLNVLDEVMSRENIDLVAGRVREGASVVLTARTGRFEPGEGKEPWPLLRALGIRPPQGTYQHSGKDVKAQIVKKNLLFDSPIRFQTTESFKDDLQSPEIKKAFWEYPYRWIPLTDYFGYYPDEKDPGGEVLARFPEGGAAVTLHRVGKGQALVFWGIPDYRPAAMKEFAARSLRWAGIRNPYEGNPVTRMQEGKSTKTDRRYAILYQDKPGVYQQKILCVPDGEYLAEEMLSDRKLGRVTGKSLREKGIRLTFLRGANPLQILRFTPMKTYQKLSYPEWKEVLKEAE